LELRLSVPPNAEAVVYLPAATSAGVTESGLALAQADGIEEVREDSGQLVLRVGSGQYAFQVGAL